MDLALLCGRILLAAVFAVAGVAKLLNPAETRKTIAEFGVRPILVNSLGSLLPAAELAVAVFLLAAPWAWWGALGALTLLSTFIAAIAMNLLKGRTPACHCFGQIRSKPIGWVTAGRNAALALCAGLIVWAGPNYASSNAVNGLASAQGQATGSSRLLPMLPKSCTAPWPPSAPPDPVSARSPGTPPRTT